MFEMTFLMVSVHSLFLMRLLCLNVLMMKLWLFYLYSCYADDGVVLPEPLDVDDLPVLLALLYDDGVALLECS